MTLPAKRKAIEELEEAIDVGSVDIDFDFFDIAKNDKETILFHMYRFMPNPEEITDLIMESKIGTLIKVDDEILGIITAIPVKSLPTGLLPTELGHIKDNTSLIVYERLINMPWQTSIPMYNMLLDDKKLKNVKDFILLARCDQSQVQKKEKKRAKTVTDYVFCEDEVLFENIESKAYFTYKKEGRLFGKLTRSALVENLVNIEKKQ